MNRSCRSHASSYWARTDVLNEVESRTWIAVADVHHRAARAHVSQRGAAYAIAVVGVAHACREEG